VADLVTLADFKTFLQDPPTGQDPLLQLVLDAAEELLEAECGRQERPFQAAQSGRVETRDGTGSSMLFLDYPIETVTSILIGADPADPDEDLDPADVAIVSWRVGRARIMRVDGDVWGCRGTPNAVQITYNTQDDLPLRAALAIQRVAAATVRRLGSEELRAERTATFSRDFITDQNDDPIWQQAVRGLREVRV
jgi:hypothetical protein